MVYMVKLCIFVICYVELSRHQVWQFPISFFCDMSSFQQQYKMCEKHIFKWCNITEEERDVQKSYDWSVEDWGAPGLVKEM